MSNHTRTTRNEKDRPATIEPADKGETAPPVDLIMASLQSYSTEARRNAGPPGCGERAAFAQGQLAAIRWVACLLRVEL